MTRLTAAVAAVVIAPFVAGCAAAKPRITPLPPAAATLACRVPIAPGGSSAADTIAWRVPARDREMLDAWCSTTGPPVISARPGRGLVGAGMVDELVVVTWNVHGGLADVAEFVRRLQSGAYTNGRPVGRFVLLLQEALRADRLVPRTAPAGVRAPRAVGGAGRAGRTDVVRLAQSLGLALHYVPSMRNGATAETEEDRGNAILSTEPLTEFAAFELPLERQRRVAVAATISTSDLGGRRRRLRVVSAHLESSVPTRRGWILATDARHRQALTLLDAIEPDREVVVGGDFNSWFGTFEPAYRTVAEKVPDISRTDARATFALFSLRLDHLFSRMPSGWAATARRLDDRLGSDHFPILARFHLPAAPDIRLASTTP